MIDLAQQIRDRLDAPRLVVEVPDKEPWTVEQIEAFRRELRKQFGTGVRIVPLDPPSDTATPQEMRAALLAVLDLTEPGEPWPADAGDSRDHCERAIDREVEARDALIVAAIAKALGIEEG